jgi:hypothetical protein
VGQEGTALSKVMALAVAASTASLWLAAVIFYISTILMVIFKDGWQDML